MRYDGCKVRYNENQVIGVCFKTLDCVKPSPAGDDVAEASLKATRDMFLCIHMFCALTCTNTIITSKYTHTHTHTLTHTHTHTHTHQIQAVRDFTQAAAR